MSLESFKVGDVVEYTGILMLGSGVVVDIEEEEGIITVDFGAHGLFRTTALYLKHTIDYHKIYKEVNTCHV